MINFKLDINFIDSTVDLLRDASIGLLHESAEEIIDIGYTDVGVEELGVFFMAVSAAKSSGEKVVIEVCDEN